MENNNESVIYCIYCGAENSADGNFCQACGESLDPQEHLLKDYVINEARDQLKSQAADTIAGKIRQFILAHLYGILLTLSIVFTASSAIAAFAASDIPKGAVRLTEPPVANVLGRLVSEKEAETAVALPDPETSAREEIISKEESVQETAAEPEVTKEPETTVEPTITEEGAVTAEAEATEEAETPSIFIAPAVYEAYLALLPEAAGDVPGYYIYDIDKDGIPELLLTAEKDLERGISVYSYDNGSAYNAGSLWGFSHGDPVPASYPEGNGIVLTEAARSYECIWVISKEGNTMNGDVRTSSNSVYEEPLYSNECTYYKNAEEDRFSSVGHQYRADTEAPFFEESRLLGFNSISDDSALKEALGL